MYNLESELTPDDVIFSLETEFAESISNSLLPLSRESEERITLGASPSSIDSLLSIITAASSFNSSDILL